MDSNPVASPPPAELSEYRVMAILKTGDNNTFTTDSRQRAIMAFDALIKNERYYRQVYIQVGNLVFDKTNLDRLP